MTPASSTVCTQMEAAAREYCQLIDQCNECGKGQYWLRRMEKLLPRIHSAVLSLQAPANMNCGYNFPNDDMRCELFMRLNQVLINDNILWSGLDPIDLKHCLCEALADDFTDIYFDLKNGLEMLQQHPQQPNYAIGTWRTSFYKHWGQHLMDAESWLHAVESRNYQSLSAAMQIFKMA